MAIGTLYNLQPGIFGTLSKTSRQERVYYFLESASTGAIGGEHDIVLLRIIGLRTKGRPTRIVVLTPKDRCITS